MQVYLHTLCSSGFIMFRESKHNVTHTHLIDSLFRCTPFKLVLLESIPLISRESLRSLSPLISHLATVRQNCTLDLRKSKDFTHIHNVDLLRSVSNPRVGRTYVTRIAGNFKDEFSLNQMSLIDTPDPDLL